jgi:hypothetical protein
VSTFAHLTFLNPASTPAQVAGGKREGDRQQDRRLLLCRPPRLALSPLSAWLAFSALWWQAIPQQTTGSATAMHRGKRGKHQEEGIRNSSSQNDASQPHQAFGCACTLPLLVARHTLPQHFTKAHSNAWADGKRASLIARILDREKAMCQHTHERGQGGVCEGGKVKWRENQVAVAVPDPAVLARRTPREWARSLSGAAW